MTNLSIAVFLLVYLGMIFGNIPFLQLDRTGIALLGAIVLVATQVVSVDEAYRSLHSPTLILLFSFMVISAQLRLGGFYTWVTNWISLLKGSPPAMLGVMIFIAAGLSAVFSNDVVCLAMAPVLVEICRARNITPMPFLIGLACAANIGSAATLIGNPQNMLIGQTLDLSFGRYFALAIVPVSLSLVMTWCVTSALQYSKGWEARGSFVAVVNEKRAEETVLFDRWQTLKGLAVAAAILAAYWLASWPRELIALAGAGLLLCSRRMHSRHMLGLVDWQLLILFMGLFVVNHAFQKTGFPSQLVSALAASGFDIREPGPLLLASFGLSNIVSNVPAVMLLLPTTVGEFSGAVLALSSTLAGNLLIVGSVANIIVVNESARKGVVIGWREHAAFGIPITFATLAITGAYLAVIN